MVEKFESIWSALEASADMLGDYAYPAMDRVAAELALPDSWFPWVAAISLFTPNAFTVAQFMRVFPYGLAQVNQERFEIAAQQCYLVADGRGGFCATALGNDAAIRTFEAANRAIAPLQSMPADVLQSMVDILARISDAALATPEPPSPFILTRKRELYRRFDMVDSLHGFVAHCLELEGYRDDAYIMTWQARRIEGHAWEAFDKLAQDGALAFEELYAQVQRRGAERDVYAQDLQELVERGWVQKSATTYELTAEGRRVRAQVEALTDEYFFAPWACLSESEFEDLSKLAIQLRDGLRETKES